MAINIQSLFSDIIETPAQRQERMLTEGILKGRELTGGLTGLARTQAPLVSALSMQMPQRQEALRRNVGGMLGLDVRTESEKVQEALKGVNPANPQSLIQAAQRIDQLGLPSQAAQLRQESARLSSEQSARRAEAEKAEQKQLTDFAQRASMLRFVQLADIDESQKQAFIGSVSTGLYDNKVEDLVERLSGDVEGRFRTVGNFIFDEESQEFLSPPSSASSERGIAGIDADLFDVQSIGRYNRALADPNVSDEDAEKLLKPKAQEGWSWQLKDGEYVERPSSGDALKDVNQEIRRANSAGRKQKSESENALRVISGMKNQLTQATETGNEITGDILGIAFSFIPGQDSYSFRTDVNTLKANLGFNALQEARQASENGASGFGQLTERELSTLESLIEDLSLGVPQSEFLDRLNTLERTFTNARDRAKSDWEIDEWIGLQTPSEPEKTTVTTSTGNTFTIEEL